MLTRLAIAAAVLLSAVGAARAGQLPIGSMPIPVSASELAAAAGVHRVDPATLPLDIVRMAFASPDGASAVETKTRAAVARVLDRNAAPVDQLPLPLGSRMWTERVLRKPIADGRLAAAIFGARSSALLYHALMGIEPATLAWLEASPAALDILYRHAAISAIYARSIRIKNGRVVTPGDGADDVWGAIVGAHPSQPTAFIDKLFSARSGRLAALYDAVAHIDPSHQAFAIGRAGDPERVARAKRLLDAVTRHVPRWRLDEYPFLRSDVDGALLLRAVRVTAAGELAPPAARNVWAQVFVIPTGEGTLDAASLAELILAGGDKVARQRLDMFLFGQRALGTDLRAATASVVKTLDGFRRYPALMLTLEHHGLDTAAFAAAAGAAAALGDDEEAIAVFQSGLAIVDRARRSGTIDPAAARASIASLVEAAAARPARAALVAWLRSGLLEPFARVVPGGGALGSDALVLSAMAGPRAQAGPLVDWENQQFRADIAGAELRRLTSIRKRQDEPPLEAALAAATSRTLGGLAHSLAAIVYADALGDPAGQAVAAGQVWRRHRFAGNDAGQPGQPIAWRLAREVFDADGWHLAGSLLRLDAALAPLALRRLDATVMPAASILSTMDRRTLAVSVALIEPRGLTDGDRDAVTAALVRGRARAASLAKDPSRLDEAADAAALSAWRQNAARWSVATGPERISGFFSVLELFRLGGGDAGATWGTTTSTIDGCLCLSFPARSAWEEFAGRPSSGQLATQLPDVLLRTAEVLAARRLPAVLARDVVAYAMQEVLDRARPVYFDDWLAVAFAARDLRDEQFDDYIATLTVAGPLDPGAEGVTVTRPLAALALAAALVVVTAGQSAPSGSARITYPEDGSYVTGAARLTIAFDPMSVVTRVRQVRWFAGGHLVCTAEVSPFSCDWDAGDEVKEHVIRAVAVLKEGGQLVANARTRAAEFAEAVDVDAMHVTTVVTDGAGRFITDLKAGDFKVYEDDKLQTLTGFAAENIPLELVTAIDVSSSMTDALPGVRRHAVNFLAQLRPTDQVTVLGFNDNIMTLVRRSTDQAARVRAIDRLKPWGGTALYDVIVEALSILGRQPGRRSLLVFSDGEDQSSRATVSAVLKRAEASDATIYVIGQGRALKTTALQNLMRQLAARSGGRAFFTDDDSKLEAIFQEIIADLRHQYLLAYPAPAHARDGEFHRIRVEVPGRGYHVRHRDGYRLTRRNPQ